MIQREVATERATGAEHRTTDLAAQLQRHQEQAEREIAQLRESQAATEAGRGRKPSKWSMVKGGLSRKSRDMDSGIVWLNRVCLWLRSLG
jgi:hypothetical protein